MTAAPITFAPVSVMFADMERRTMRALVVPWNTVGKMRDGRRWKFAPGSLLFAAEKYIRLNDEHVHSSRIGRAVAAENTPEGLVLTFAVQPGAKGDRALAGAVEGTKTGFSIEIEMDDLDGGPDPEDPRVTLVQMAHLTEVAHTRAPVFNDARLIEVRASQGGTGMPDEPITTPATNPAPDPTTTPPAAPAVDGPVTLSAEQFSQMMGRLAPPVEVRATVDPSAGTRTAAPAAPVTTREALPYQFSRLARGKYYFSSDTEHDFSTDVFAMLDKSKSGADYSDEVARLNGFVKAVFADIEIADLPGTLVSVRRPDMWVPQMDYATPLWDLTGRGPTPEGGRKFDVPKFTSASGLVAVATEKTEPAGGSFVDELQTITPGQLWGKVEITRQVWRQGGNPAFSGIMWEQMVRSFYEAREAAIATFLATLTAATDIALTGTPASTPDNDDDQVTMNDLETALADLQFVRGGNRFSAFAVQQNLYRVMARVKDDAGRPLYPQIAPQNANGTTANLYKTINIGGTTSVPAYALGAGGGTASGNSWLFDPAKVMAWAGSPERLFWDFGATVQTANLPQLSWVTLGLYADYATANTDINGVRQVTFDPSV